MKRPELHCEHALAPKLEWRPAAHKLQLLALKLPVVAT
jgi:hypothetical protein